MKWGVACGVAAGLLWGLVFVAPLWLADYPAVWLSVGRYLAFGLLALPLAWWDRTRLRTLSRADWIEALKLSLVGNLMYYVALAASVQRAGAPLTSLVIGTLPIVLVVVANLTSASHERLRWATLAPAIALMAAGLALVNRVEFARVSSVGQSPQQYALGAALAVVALICWTIYPLRNARWLRAHPTQSSVTWATAQGVATLPLAAAGFAAVSAWSALQDPKWALPLGPRPWVFVGVCALLGVVASWMGTWLWNEASQRLPATISGPLIVFETIAALAYALMVRGEPPSTSVLVGAVLLVVGVVVGLRAVHSVRPAPA
jgi:drug/metabolite transporter (DMT)-like permease